MSTNVQIIFETDSLIAENETVKDFVKNSPAGHCSVLLEGTHYIVVKENKKTPLTLEKVRSTAGNIARDLSGRKVEAAEVSAEVLTNGFADLDNTDLLTAFADGWDLGAHQFVAYKQSVRAFKTACVVAGNEAERASGTGGHNGSATT